MSYVEQVVQEFTTGKEAQRVIAALIEKFATSAAVETLRAEGRYQKRTWRAVAYHTAGNLLRYGRSRRAQY